MTFSVPQKLTSSPSPSDILSNRNLENRNDLYRCRIDKGVWQEIVVAGAGPTQSERPVRLNSIALPSF